MTLDLSIEEGELLIAVLMFAEMAAITDPAMSPAIADLRDVRSRLVFWHLRDRQEFLASAVNDSR